MAVTFHGSCSLSYRPALVGPTVGITGFGAPIDAPTPLNIDMFAITDPYVATTHVLLATHSDRRITHLSKLRTLMGSE